MSTLSTTGERQTKLRSAREELSTVAPSLREHKLQALVQRHLLDTFQGSLAHPIEPVPPELNGSFVSTSSMDLDSYAMSMMSLNATEARFNYNNFEFRRVSSRSLMTAAYFGWLPSLPYLLLDDVAPNSVRSAYRWENNTSQLPQDAYKLTGMKTQHFESEMKGRLQRQFRDVTNEVDDEYRKALHASPENFKGLLQKRTMLDLRTQALGALIDHYEIPARKSFDLLQRTRDAMLLRRAYYVARAQGDIVTSPFRYKRVSKRQTALLQGWINLLRPAYQQLKQLGQLIDEPMSRIDRAYYTETLHIPAPQEWTARITPNPLTEEERHQLAAIIKKHVTWSLFAAARIEELLVAHGARPFGEVHDVFVDFNEIANDTLLTFQRDHAKEKHGETRAA